MAVGSPNPRGGRGASAVQRRVKALSRSRWAAAGSPWASRKRWPGTAGGLPAAPRRAPGSRPAGPDGAVAAQQDGTKRLGDAVDRDRQVQGVVPPGGVVEVQRAGLPPVVQDVAQVQVGMDQPVHGRARAESGQHRLDPVGHLAEQPPGGRVDRPAGELGGVGGAGPGQPPHVEGWAGEAGRRAEPAGVAVQGGQDAAEVGDQPPRRAGLAVAALDPREGDAAPPGRPARGWPPGCRSGPPGRSGRCRGPGRPARPARRPARRRCARRAGTAAPPAGRR